MDCLHIRIWKLVERTLAEALFKGANLAKISWDGVNTDKRLHVVYFVFTMLDEDHGHTEVPALATGMLATHYF